MENEYEAIEKKKTGRVSRFFGKLAVIIASGLVFGLCAAVAFGVVEYYTKDAKEQTEEFDKEAIDGSVIDTIKNVEEASTVVTDVTDVVDKVMPSVVSITNKYTATANFWGQMYSEEAEASGSGIIIGENDNELLIATNNHVISDAESLEVQFIDGSDAKAHVKGADADMDVAVIAVAKDDLDGSTKDAISIPMVNIVITERQHLYPKERPENIKDDGSSELVKSLLEDYSISDDGLVYSFTLKDGLKFSDGSDLTSEDVEYTFTRMFALPESVQTDFTTAILGSEAVYINSSFISADSVAEAPYQPRRHTYCKAYHSYQIGIIKMPEMTKQYIYCKKSGTDAGKAKDSAEYNLPVPASFDFINIFLNIFSAVHFIKLSFNLKFLI